MEVEYLGTGPLVTILCTTYNHVNYIEDALQGFINQRCDFEYKIIVHDDCSNDGTQEILRKYENLYPDIIRVIYEDENQYSKGNLRKKIFELKDEFEGKYIALCEGDDYWIDSNKLQIQVSYLERNNDCTLTGHNTLHIDCRSGKQCAQDGFEVEQDVNVEDVLKYRRGCFQLASYVMRKEVYFSRPELYCMSNAGDWLLLVYAATIGRVHYFDRIMSVYRYYSVNSWTTLTYSNQTKYAKYCIEMAHFFDEYDKHTEHKHHNIISCMIDGFYYTAAAKQLDCSFEELSVHKKELLSELNETELSYADSYFEAVLKMKEEGNRINEYISNHDETWIMGTGVVSEQWSKRIMNWGNNIEGYVVSDNQVAKGEMLGKRILHLKDFAWNTSVGLIIAIQSRHKNEVEENLKKYGIDNAIWILG